MEMRFVSLAKWPGVPTKPGQRQRSRFDTPWSKTLDLLERELQFLRAREVVIQADCDRDQIRLDGMFRANAKLRGPGVVLSFESKHGPLSYPCDTFTDWQDNVRAIALALEALRAVDRYGVTRQAEQYKGWAALPDKSQQGAFPDAVRAADWLSQEIGLVVHSTIQQADAETRDHVRRQAVKTFHPDRNNGDDSRWKLWIAAAQLLSIEV